MKIKRIISVILIVSMMFNTVQFAFANGFDLGTIQNQTDSKKDYNYNPTMNKGEETIIEKTVIEEQLTIKKTNIKDSEGDSYKNATKSDIDNHENEDNPSVTNYDEEKEEDSNGKKEKKDNLTIKPTIEQTIIESEINNLSPVDESTNINEETSTMVSTIEEETTTIKQTTIDETTKEIIEEETNNSQNNNLIASESDIEKENVNNKQNIENEIATESITEKEEENIEVSTKSNAKNIQIATKTNTEETLFGTGETEYILTNNWFDNTAIGIGKGEVQTITIIKSPTAAPDASTYKYDIADSNGLKVYVNNYDVTIYAPDNLPIYTAEDSGGLFDMTSPYVPSISSIVGLDLLDTSRTKNMSGMFRYYRGRTLDVSNFDTRNVTNMSNMFAWCESLTSIDVSSFVTASVSDMSVMFERCERLTSLDLSNFDTSNVTTMREMFASSENIETLNVSSFDTSKVTNMDYMFHDMQALTSLDISSFDTSNVTTMEELFFNGKVLKTIYASDKFVTTNVAAGNDARMFLECLVLEGGNGTKYSDRLAADSTTAIDGTYAKIDKIGQEGYFTSIGESGTTTNEYILPNNWYNETLAGEDQFRIEKITISRAPTEAPDTSGYTYKYDIPGSNGLKLYLSGKNINIYAPNNYPIYTAKDSSHMFDMRDGEAFTSLYSLSGIELLDTSRTTNMEEMFSYYGLTSVTSLTELNFENFNTKKVTNMKNMFKNNCSSIINLNSFVTASVSDMSGMFYGCEKITNLNFSKFDTSNVTNMEEMFYGCKALTYLDLSSFDTSKVATMSYMFYDLEELTSLDVSSFDTSNVVEMKEMFYKCEKLVSLDLSKFKTSKVTDMSRLFYGMKALKNLYINDFDTSNVTTMEEMFCDLNNITVLNLSNFNTSNVINMKKMFYYCYSLTTIYARDTFVTTQVTQSTAYVEGGDYRMFYNCAALTGGKGTKYENRRDSSTDEEWEYAGKQYAKIDATGNIGYFTQGDSVKINSISWDENGIFTVDFSFPANDSYYTLSKLQYYLNFEPDYVYSPVYAKTSGGGRSQAFGSYYALSGQFKDGADYSKVDFTKGRGIITVDMTSKIVKGPSSPNSGDPAWEDFKNEYRGWSIDFSIITFFSSATTINYGNEWEADGRMKKYRTKVATDRLHKWKTDWKNNWTYWEINDGNYAPVNYKLAATKRIGVVDSKVAWDLLSGHLEYGDDGVANAATGGYSLYFNTSLGISAIAENYNGGAAPIGERIIYFILDPGEAIVFDGDNSKALFKDTEVYNVDWRAIGKSQKDIDDTGLTTMESWFEGMDFRSNWNDIEGATIESNTYFRTAGRARLDMFLHLNLKNLVSVKDMFKNAKDVANHIDIFTNDDVQDAGTGISGDEIHENTVTYYYNTPNLTDMSGLFEGAIFNCRNVTQSRFKDILSHLLANNVTDMSRMFKSIRWMFSTNIGNTSIDISHFETPNLTNISEMFMSTYFTTVIIDETKWTTVNVTKDKDVFNGTFVVGENGSSHNDGFTTNDKRSAIRDTYFTPGYFTHKEGLHGDTGLHNVSFTSIIKQHDGTYVCDPGTTNISKGLIYISASSNVYRSYTHVREEDTHTSDFNGIQDRYRVKGFKPGEEFSLYQKIYDEWAWPKLGDNAHRYSNVYAGGLGTNMDAVYAFVGFEDQNHNPLTFDETEKKFSPTLTVQDKTLGQEIHKTNPVNQVFMVWLEVDKKATFKSQYGLTGDVERWFAAYGHVQPINDLKVNQLIEDGGNHYKFKGWRKEGETTLYNFNTRTESDDVIFNAVWEATDVVTVHFVDDEGIITGLTDVTIAKGLTVTRPENPRNGFEQITTTSKHTFLYWYEDGYDFQFDFTMPIMTDTTVKIKWKIEEPKFDVKFVSDHFGPFATQSVLYGQKAVDNMGYVEGRRYIDGSKYYIFNGWRSDDDNRSITDKTIEADTTFNAYWTEDTNTGFIKVSFNPVHGSWIIKDIYVTIDEVKDYWNNRTGPLDISTMEPANGTKVVDGNVVYELQGWADAPDYGYDYDNWWSDVGYYWDEGDHSLFHNITFYGQWSNVTNQWTRVMYESDKGVVNPTMRYLKADPTLTINMSQIQIEDTYKDMTETEWEIYYQPISPRVGDVVTEGDKEYKLVKWMYQSDEQSSDTDLPAYSLRYYYDYNNWVKFKAVWLEVKNYDVSFTNTKGIVIATQSVPVGSKSKQPTQLVNGDIVEENGINYSFNEWRDKNNYTFDFNTLITEDTVLTAKWDIGYIDINFESQYNTSNKPASIRKYIGELPYNLTEPSNSYFVKNSTVVNSSGRNYKFMYWYATSSNVPYEFPKQVRENLTLFAYWKQLENVTLTYDPSPFLVSQLRIQSTMDAGITTQEVVKGEPITTYYPYSPGYGNYNYSSTPYSRLAGWKYTDENNIEHILNNGTNPISFNQNTTFTTVMEYQKEAKFLDRDGNVIKENINWFNIDYTTYGGYRIPNSDIPTQYVKDTTKVNDATARKSYIFRYWYASSSTITEFNFNTRLTDNTIFKPYFEEVPFTWDVKVSIYQDYQATATAYQGLLDGLSSKTYSVNDGDEFILPYPVGSWYKSNEYYYGEINKYARKVGTGWSDLPKTTTKLVINQDEELRIHMMYNKYNTNFVDATFKSQYYTSAELEEQVFKVAKYSSVSERFYPPNWPAERDIYDNTAVDGKQYVMRGWYLEGDTTKALVTFPQQTNTNITYVALWEEYNPYQVTFDIVYDGESYSGGVLSDPPTQELLRGELVTEPDIVDTSTIITIGTNQYRFKYWWATDSNVPYDFSRPVDGNMDLTAFWQLLGARHTYKFIGIDLNDPDAEVASGEWYEGDYPGGYIISSSVRDSSNEEIIKDQYSIDDVPNNTQMTFKYWYDVTGPDTIEFDFSIPQTNDIVLKAKYVQEELKMTVTFIVYNNSGSAYTSDTSLQGIFDGQSQKKYKVKQGDTLRLPYPAGNYYKSNVSDRWFWLYRYELQNGTSWTTLWQSNSTSYTTKELIINKDEIIRLYFYDNINEGGLVDQTFIWGPDHANPEIPTEVLKVRTSSYFQYYPPVTYLVNDIYKDSSNQKYRFLGWSEDSSLSPILADSDWPKSQSSDKTYWAVWEPILEYDIIFIDTHKTPPPATISTTGEKIARPTTHTPGESDIVDGGITYRFDDWYEVGTTTPFDFVNTSVTRPYNIEARYRKVFNEQFYITYPGVAYSGGTLTNPPNQEVLEGGYITEPNIVDTSTIITAGTDQLRFRYWWATDSNVPYDFSRPVDDEWTLTAHWTSLGNQKTYRFIGIDLNNPSAEVASGTWYEGDYPGGYIISDAVKDSTNVDIIKDVYYIRDTANKVQHTFKYWYSTDSNIPFDFSIPQFDDVTLTAKYQEETIKWQVTMEVAYGTNAPNPSYRFEGVLDGEYTKTYEITDGETFRFKNPPGSYYKKISDSQYYQLNRYERKTGGASEYLWSMNSLYQTKEVAITQDETFRMYFSNPVYISYMNTITFIWGLDISPASEQIRVNSSYNYYPPSRYLINEIYKDSTNTNYKLLGWRENSPTGTLLTDANWPKTDSGDKTYYADWAPSYEVDFNAVHEGESYSGGIVTNPSIQNLAEGQYVTAPSEFDSNMIITVGTDRYRFKYWWATDSNVPYDFSRPVDSSMTLTAYWQILQNEKTYKFVGIDLDNPNAVIASGSWFASEYPTGYIIPSVIKDSANADIVNDVYVIKDTVNKIQHTFKYWYVDGGDSNTEFDFTAPQTNDIVLRAKWLEERIKWKVTLEVAYGDNAALDDTYTFEGIMDGQNSKIYEIEDGETFKLEYPAGTQYKRRNWPDTYCWYRVRYYIRRNGTSWTYLWYYANGSYNTREITINQDERIRIIMEGSAEETDLYDKTFKWGPEDYNSPEIPNTVLRVYSSDPYYPPTDYLVGDKYKSPTTGKKFKFLGWAESETGSPISDSSWPKSQSSAKTYFAKWQEISEHTVTYTDDYKTPPRAVDVTTGEKTTRPTTHTAGEADIIVGTETYRFIDWYATDSELPFDFANTNITKDITIEARYKNVTQYDIDFNINLTYENARKPANQLVTWGDKLTTPSTIDIGYLSKQYVGSVLDKVYRFNYWYSTDSNIPYDFENELVKSKFTMTASWSEIPVYSVTFDAVHTNSTITTPDSQRVIQGEYAATPSNFDTNTLWERRNSSNVVVEAYRFKYWYETDDTVPFDFKNTKITKTTNIKATWSTVPLYTVEFTDTTGYLALSQLQAFTLPAVIEGISAGAKIATPTEISDGTVVKIGVGNYYQFNGWYDGASKFDFENTEINADYSLNINWAPFSGAVVAFDSNGHFTGRTIPGQTVYPDVHIQLPVAPNGINAGEYEEVSETDGFVHRYTFVHWYEDGTDENTAYNFSVDPTNNITLKAKYTDQKYNTIKFNLRGIEVVTTPSEQTKLDGELVDKPTELTENQSYPYSGRTYRFDYWYATSSTVPYNFSRPLDDNYEIKAYWTDVTPWHINYDAIHVANPAQDTVINGDKATAPVEIDTNTVKVYTNTSGERTAAYRFDYWYEIDDTVPFDFAGIDIFRDYNLTAKWSSIPLYNVTFADPDGHLGNASIYPVGLDVPAAYHGLYQGEQVATPTNIKENDVIRIGVAGSGSYYKFLGWYESTTDTKYNFNAGINATITLNAKWAPFSGAVVTFDSNGHFTGRTIPEQTVYPDVHIQLPVAPNGINAGEYEEVSETDGFIHRYTFVHWYEEGTDENTAYNFLVDPTNNITLKAKYTDQKLITVKFDTNGIVATPPDMKIVVNEAITRPTNPQNNQVVTHTDGHQYKFIKWYISTDTTETAFNFSAGANNHITLKCKWLDVTPWLVTFDIGKNITNETKTVVNGNTTTPILKPVAGTINEVKNAQGIRTEASEFVCWYLSTDTTETPFDFTTPITSNITLKGKWNNLPLRTVTFTDSNNIFVNEDTEHIRRLPSQIQGMLDGEKVVEPTLINKGDIIKTKDNHFYQFKGWFNGAVLYNWNQGLAGNLVLNATWDSINAYEVTYSSEYVAPSKLKENVMEGNKATAPVEPKVNQEYTVADKVYKFNYWYATNSNIAFNFETKIYAEYNLKALWTLIKVEPSKSNTQTGDSGGGGGSSGYISSIPVDNLTPNKVIQKEKDISKDKEVKSIVEDFIVTGEIKGVNSTDINVEELKALRKLVNNESGSSDTLTEDPRKSWHKISRSVWYYANKDVGLLRGWHHDEQDTQFYHLDEKTGIMSVGWTKIDGQYYYFSEDPDSDNWYSVNGEWTTKNRNDISIGSMYVNRRTPDGYFVDEYGHYVESAGQLNAAQMIEHLKTQEQFLAEQNLTVNQERELANILDANTMKEIQQLRDYNSVVANSKTQEQYNDVNSNFWNEATNEAMMMTSNELLAAQAEYYRLLAYQQALVERMLKGDKEAEQEYLAIINANKANQNK